MGIKYDYLHGYDKYGVYETIKLDGTDWQILSLASEMTEEKARQIVHSLPSVFGHYRDYKDYTKPYDVSKSQYTFTTALESFKSWLKSLELVVENPYPKPNGKRDFSGSDEDKLIWDYDEVQKLVQNLLIIYKNK